MERIAPMPTSNGVPPYPQLIRKECGNEFTSRRTNNRRGQPGRIGNAPQRSKLCGRMMMRPRTSSQFETIIHEPRENWASTLFVVLGRCRQYDEHRRRGFRKASHVGCTLRATPDRRKRLSPLGLIEHDATLYPECDSGATSSGINTDDDGPTMRRGGRTEPGTPSHPRFFTRPPPRSPGHAQGSSPNHLPPIFSI